MIGLVLGGLVIAGNVLVALLAWRLRTEMSTEQPRVGDTVVCPECGTDNEAGYRFCRECVSDLPGPAAYAGTQTGRRSLPLG